MYLAGDIGGTKTVLALIEENNGFLPVAEGTFPSAQYPNLEAIVRDFLGKNHAQVQKATFGVAGPVVDGMAQITNLPWHLGEKKLEESLEIPEVNLINDLVAIAYGILVTGEDELICLQRGTPIEGGSIAVIAPGTGLGEAYLTHDGHRYRAYPSEGGHVDFAPTQALEFGLLRYLRERFGHVSYERICSGSGFPNIYYYLKEMGYAEEPAWLAKKIQESNDPTPVIVNAALDKENACDLARTALQTFVSILGAETGNLALKVLATGGVYMAGGIPPKILPALTDGLFVQSFLKKGRFGDVLGKFPIWIVNNPKVGLLGSANYMFSTH